MTQLDETNDATELRRVQALDAVALLANRLGLSSPRVAWAITGRRYTWTETLQSKRQLRYVVYSQIMRAVSALWPPKHEWPAHIPRFEADASLIERPDVLIDKDEEEPSTETQGAAA